VGSAPLARRALTAATLLASLPASALEAELSGGPGVLAIAPQHELVAFPLDPSPIGATYGASLRGTVYPVRLPWRLEAGLSWEGDLQTGAALVGGHRGFASLGLPVPRVAWRPVVQIGAGLGVLGARSEALGRDMDWSPTLGGGLALPVIGEHGRIRLDLRYHLAPSAGFDTGGSGHVGTYAGFGWVFGRARWAATRNQVLDLVSSYEDSPTEEEFTRLGDLGQQVLIALAREGTLPPSRASRVVSSMAYFPDETTQRFLEKKAAQGDPYLQRKAVWALVSGYGDEAIPFVQEVLASSDDMQMRVAISKALDHLDTPAAAEALQELPGIEIDAVDVDGGAVLDDVRLVITHPDGRTSSHLGHVRFVDASLPEGSAWTIEARRGRCERGQARAETLGELTEVQVPLEPHREGTLLLAVTTPDGEPVPGAKVTLRTDEPACAPGEPPVLESASGSIALGEGTYEVFVEREGYGTTQHEVTIAAGSQEVVLPVQLAPSLVSIEAGKLTTQHITFDSGRATLRAESLPALQEIATALGLLDTGTVLIEGHTDDRGDAARNLALSQDRADAVRAQLIELGVDASRLEAEGFGASRPIADNGTAAGRAENRRVDFVLRD